MPPLIAKGQFFISSGGQFLNSPDNGMIHDRGALILANTLNIKSDDTASTTKDFY
jgi:hypothetical protein